MSQYPQPIFRPLDHPGGSPFASLNLNFFFTWTELSSSWEAAITDDCPGRNAKADCEPARTNPTVAISTTICLNMAYFHSPIPMGSDTDTNTIGTLPVAFCRAAKAGVLWDRITSGASATSSAASPRILPASPAGHR